MQSDVLSAAETDGKKTFRASSTTRRHPIETASILAFRKVRWSTAEETENIINIWAPSGDDLEVEIAGDVIVPWLEQIFWRVWETVAVSTDWRTVVLLPLFKTGDNFD